MYNPVWFKCEIVLLFNSSKNFNSTCMRYSCTKCSPKPRVLCIWLILPQRVVVYVFLFPVKNGVTQSSPVVMFRNSTQLMLERSPLRRLWYQKSFIIIFSQFNFSLLHAMPALEGGGREKPSICFLVLSCIPDNQSSEYSSEVAKWNAQSYKSSCHQGI